MKNYGVKIGTAYQIYDDCLDIAGTEAETGKTLGTDLRKGKLTLPVLTLLESASAFDRERCCALVLEGKLEEVTALLQNSPAHDALGASIDTASELIRAAQAELAATYREPVFRRAFRPGRGPAGTARTTAQLSSSPDHAGFPRKRNMAQLKIREMPKDDRPREKLAARGAIALNDAELIAILLRTGVEGANAIEVARQLIEKYGSLGALSRCTVQELAKIKGIGFAKGAQLAAAFGLGQRLAREIFARQKIETPEQVYELLGTEMRALHKESLRTILLDTRYNLIRVEDVSLGSVNESIAHPRDVFRPALIYSAYAVVVVHNHPSGDPIPQPGRSRPNETLARGSRAAPDQTARSCYHRCADGRTTPLFQLQGSGRLVKIHPTALIDPRARLAEDVEVGPFSCIGPEVEIGARTDRAITC